MDKDNKKSKIAEREEEILRGWQESHIFEKSLNKKTKDEFIFYDGPPFATGLPHFGHILAGTMKDYIGRFKTMQGKHVERKWGWDCHGLPIENIVEKDLGLKSKKDIEEMGLKKFNELARSKVFTYVNDWKKIVPRMGRFVDMSNDYKTLDPKYSETIWWIFKTLNDKGLVYEGFKSMHLCPHCGTTLSNFEVNQGYKDITDISVFVKFKVADEDNTYFLAWTTTPWTLPGNVALAVGKDIDYVKVKIKDVYLILAKSRLSVLKEEYQIVSEMKGSGLVGKSYKPIFEYYNNKDTKNIDNAFRVYEASFVTTEDGTGIVHIAPAFGEDDMNLGKEKELPFIQHVDMSGRFKKEVVDFANMPVKPKDDHQKADVDVIKHLAHSGTLFAKEKIIHSYPHCYRCDTPLINYASSSWFVEVTKIKNKLVEENKKIHWIPDDVGDGRFGKWLEGARDWAISRSRFWGAPLPVWRCTECGEKEFIGSVEDLKKKTSSGNKFFVVRHGEADSNVLGILSSDQKTEHHLTENGKKQAQVAGKDLRKKKIDIIYSSPFLRTKETAEIIAHIIGFDKEKIIYDSRLHEVSVGVLDGKTDAEYQAFFGSREEKFWKIPEGGESHTDVKKRMTDFLYEINEKNAGKNILIVSHNTPIWLMFAGALGMTPQEAIKIRESGQPFVHNSEIKELPFAPIPHNENYELDLHRPYIDDIKFKCKCGGEMKRVPEVFDCWFESGSMPYAQSHYPFENLDKFNPLKNIGFPADFIAEGLDQTRGWFYSMLVLSVALFGKSSYKNVIVNGIILAEDGQKMSKRLRNYSDPMDLVDKYSADAMRMYLLSSPVVKAEDFRFSDKGVDEVMKKVMTRLFNVYSFYEMYKGDVKGEKIGKNVLDLWILARLKETISSMAKHTEKYELDRAVRPIFEFVDDFSTWYLRRSRDRFKSEDIKDRESAIATTRFVLENFAKAIAPSMPFLAEDIYLKVAKGERKESVHLEDWPKDFSKGISRAEEKIIELMKKTREISSLGLEARTKLSIKVRQPLANITVKDNLLADEDEYLSIIKDEINVKNIFFNTLLETDVLLDSNITPELREEGIFRELVRAIQEKRKEKKLNPSDIISLRLNTDEVGRRVVTKFESDIKKISGVSDIIELPDKLDNIVEIEGVTFSFNF